MRREKAVLNVKERRVRRLGRPATNQAQIARLLGVAAKQHSPADVGNAHQVVVAGMDIQRVASQCPRSDVHHHRQPLPRNRVQHFLHQDQSLARREIGHAAT